MSIKIPLPHVDDGVLESAASSLTEDLWNSTANLSGSSDDMEVSFYFRVEVSADDPEITDVTIEHESGDWSVNVSSREAAKNFLGDDLLDAIDAIEERMRTQYENAKQERRDADDTHDSLRNLR